MTMSRIEKSFVNSKRRQTNRVAQARRLLASVPLQPGLEYLEVGCGTGAVTRFVAESYGFHAIGVDIDPEQLAEANKEASGPADLRFEVADARALPYLDKSFDMVLSFMATHHIEDVDAALHEIARVLRPGGYFVYADIFLPAVIAVAGGLFGHAYRLPRSDRFLAAVRAAGFDVLTASRQRERFYGRFEAVLRNRAGVAAAPAVSGGT
jgi:ubiquinone/menaquinone biosynthesis C-methylase UbiE